MQDLAAPRRFTIYMGSCTQVNYNVCQKPYLAPLPQSCPGQKAQGEEVTIKDLEIWTPGLRQSEYQSICQLYRIYLADQGVRHQQRFGQFIRSLQDRFVLAVPGTEERISLGYALDSLYKMAPDFHFNTRLFDRWVAGLGQNKALGVAGLPRGIKDLLKAVSTDQGYSFYCFVQVYAREIFLVPDIKHGRLDKPAKVLGRALPHMKMVLVDGQKEVVPRPEPETARIIVHEAAHIRFHSLVGRSSVADKHLDERFAELMDKMFLVNYLKKYGNNLSPKERTAVEAEIKKTTAEIIDLNISLGFHPLNLQP